MYSIVGRVVGNIVLSVVYVFLVRALLRGRRWAYRRVIWLGSAGIVALLALQATPSPVWVRAEQLVQAQHNHTFWSFDAQSQAHEGRWAQGKTLIGDHDIVYLAAPIALGGDDAMIPPPDPNLFATYDGAMGKPKSGDATGARKQGAQRD